MGKVYVYDHHDGWEDMMFISDHALTDGERFCRFCEDWDTLIGCVNTREELNAILNSHSIFEDKGYDTETYQILMEKFEKITAPGYKRQIVPKEKLQVGLFFFVEGNFAVAGCPLSKAESYGDFLIYSESHYDVWNKYRYLKFKDLKEEVAYDYYPRGRVVYRKTDDTFIIYYDKCVEKEIHRIADAYIGYKYKLELDEHYCCHKCNKYYVE